MFSCLLQNRVLLYGLVAGCLATVGAGPARADWTWAEGGLLDLSTGLAWSQSQAGETGSWWTWNGAATRAAGYVVNEFDDAGNVVATYDDWRVPTVKELQTAIANGTIEWLIPRNEFGGPIYGGKVWLWSSESRGTKGWAVSLEVNALGEVIGGGEARLFLKGSGFDVFLVRNAAP